MENLCKLSGTELARLIREGEATSVEIVEAHIRQIQKVNPTLNAVVADRFEQARQEAQAADAKLSEAKKKDDLPPFLGVPCSIKECFAFAGMPNTAGIVARRGIVPDQDATAVARIRAAGAIPLGVTNTSEGCMWMESSNYVYGRTNNPYNPAHIVGGSSGGEGAIIAAGGSPFGLGSDIGGSIRMPAFFNGVFGHKASGGLVPNTGQYPIAAGPALRYLTTGPLARRAEDIWPLLQLLKGPDGLDEGCQEIALGDPAQVDFSRLKVLVVKGNGVVRVAADMLEAQARAAEALAKRGATVSEGTFTAFKKSRDIWTALLNESGSEPFKETIGRDGPISAGREFFKWVVRASNHTLPAIVLAALENLPAMMPARYRRFAEMGRELKQEMNQRLGEDGLLLYPSYPTAAPRHHKPIFPPFNWVYTAILNVLEIPVTQTPLGLNAAGLPLGVQVGAAHGNDHLTVAAALALQEDLGGWVPPRQW
ncbi:MAG: amidase [Candidatus Lernaella stagnicola]|nr:amidase [Candidatus Lernaella stagnicola]